MTEKLKEHDSEIKTLKDQFKDLKRHVDERFDLIMDQLKPTFTDGQKIGLLVTITALMISVSIYVGGIKSDTRNNTTRIDHSEKMDEIKFGKLDEILNIVNMTRTDVEVLKSKNENIN